MILAPTPADTERFRDAIASCAGLHFADAKLPFLAEILRERLETAKRPLEAYLSDLEAGGADGELSALSRTLTVPETYFFRHNGQFRAFTEIALPARMRAQAVTKTLRILSAGCASGEEAYTLGIILRETLDASWRVSILGVDINPAMVSKATRAHYSSWSLRETPADVQRRWFTADGREFTLAESVRSTVTFEECNLVKDGAPVWQDAAYDVVFFRNVLMYFTVEKQQAVVASVARALKPGGYLFLGHAETLRGLSGAFHLRHTHDAFYYQRKDSNESAASAPVARHPTRDEDDASAPLVDAGETWFDAIARASKRIEALSSPAPATSPLSASTRGPAWDLRHALVLMREERFADALEAVLGLPRGAAKDPDSLLLSASLYTHLGRLREAEEACHRLLGVDELNAGAHHVLALCRDAAHDNTTAMYHDRVAIYLDPNFAMPHLHLGLLARRTGDRVAAQRELGDALLLLPREDALRLLFFGGGFSREALLALCRTELHACGGAS
jgi:chemotaxis protein methyltransferase CheR